MSSDAWDKGLKVCRRGENAQKRGKLQKASDFYTEGLEILLVAIHQTPNDTVKNKRRAIARQYMEHAELLKAQLTGKPVPAPVVSSSTSSKPVDKRKAAGAARSVARGRVSSARSSASSAHSSSSPAPSSRPTSASTVPSRRKKASASGGGAGDEYVKRIEQEILSEKPNVKFDDIAGLQAVKDALYETVILPSQRPDVFTGLRAPPKGILVFGPPGNGKTMVAKAVATEANCTFFNISASSLTSRYVGEGEKMVRAMFQVARERQPAIVFIDEIDSLLTSRGQNENDAARRIKTEFLVQFDGVASDAEDRVLVMGATNLPQELDDAVLRRFPKKFLIPLPDAVTRSFLIQHLLKSSNFKHRLSKRDLAEIVRQTDGYSGSDLAALTKDAAMGPVRDAGDAIKKANFKAKHLPPISLHHFQQSLQFVRPSVPQESLAEMNKWNAMYGSTVRQNGAAQAPSGAAPRRVHSELPPKSEHDGFAIGAYPAESITTYQRSSSNGVSYGDSQYDPPCSSGYRPPPARVQRMASQRAPHAASNSRPSGGSRERGRSAGSPADAIPASEQKEPPESNEGGFFWRFFG